VDTGDFALLLLKLDDVSAIGNYIGSRQPDLSLARIASALSQVFPWPALCSRLMGNAYLVFTAHDKREYRQAA